MEGFVFAPNLLCLCIYTPVTHEHWTRKPRTVILVLGSFLVAYIHSPNNHRGRHLQVTVCFCDQVAYKHSANQKL